jgi:hypothetical protein
MKKIQLFKVAIAVTMALVFGLSGCEQPDKDSAAGSVADGLLSLNKSVTEGGATVSNVTVTGSSGSDITPVPLTITLTDNGFVEIEAGTPVTSWFTNLPAGLCAKATYDVNYDDTEITITISDEPTYGSAQVMSITIPADMLTDDRSDIPVTRNPGAKYDITSVIGTLAQLQTFANAVNSGDTAQKGLLAADITLPASWMPIAPNDGSHYTGTFNGGKKTIRLTGFDAKALDAMYLGIFGCVSGTISNLNIDVNLSLKPTSFFSFDFGALAGFTQNATLDNITVSGTMTFILNTYAYIGGVSGYLTNGTISNSAADSLTLNITNTGDTTYAGGISGYADAASITVSRASGSITVSAQGLNTAVGGLAGYVTSNVTIDSCRASNTVHATAIPTQPITQDNAYAVYAGGLLGNAGGGVRSVRHPFLEKSLSLSGDAAGGVTTTKSYASGTVYAKSVYPYAGGLVGYSFGNPSGGQGSAISQCYATGAATAESDWGLPYAGGIAGCNFGPLANITESYAIGAVQARSTATGFAWAGGIAGANGNNALIAKCYSTGDVVSIAVKGPLPTPQPQIDEGALAGGIAGYSYYTERTGIAYSVALNAALTGTGARTDVYRVVGRNGYSGGPAPALIDNWAFEKMNLTPGHTINPDPDGLDGGNTIANPDKDFYVSRTWDFGRTWKMDRTNAYPILQWQP